MELVVVRGKKDIKPLLLRLGFAIALSFAGFLVSHLRFRRLSRSSSGTYSETGGKGLKDELRILKTISLVSYSKRRESLSKIINGTSTTTTTTTTTTTFVGLSPTSKSSGDEEGFLLPEFNDLCMKEFELSGRNSDAAPTSQTPKNAETREETVELEMVQLKNLVMFLRERERDLELQLLEYYGLQEQEAAMRELESQVRINKMEAKLFSIKIESLQAENQRLQARLLDCSKTMTEIDVAKAKVKSLKRKLKTDGEEAREKMTTLQRKISMLQNRMDIDGRDRADFERKLQRFEELEDEALKLRMLNSGLAHENMELNKKLEASSLERDESETSEEAERLREVNEKLTKEVEQLKTDRCADVEELVYLRWVNACLRYELRNYQPPPGKTVARDLSKSLSPKSEERAKKLIVEYANSGVEEKTLNLVDFDLDYSSSSQASVADSDDTSNENSYTARHSSNKSNFFAKLKKLVLGKDNHGNRASSADRTAMSYADSDRRVSFSTYSVDDMIGRSPCNSLSPSISEELGIEDAQFDACQQRKNAESHGRPSSDIQRLRKLNLEEDRERKCDIEKNIGRSYSFQRMNSLDGSSTGVSQAGSVYGEDTRSPEKMELKKFAEVLQKSQGSQINMRWASSGN